MTHETLDRRSRLMLWGARASMTTALCLIALKAWGGWKTHALTLWTLMADSFLDVIASTINFLFIRQAVRPPDESFPYGYGKAEAIAALSQSYIILFSALILIYEDIRALLHPRSITNVHFGTWILGLSWLITLLLLLFLLYIVRKTHSNAIRADAFHYQTDLLTNLGGILSLWFIQRYRWSWIDPAFSMIIVLYMISGALRLTRASIHELLDKADPKIRERVFQAVRNFHPKIRNPHDFRARRVGSRLFIELHVEIDRRLSFEDAHDLAEDLIDRIRQEFPDTEVTVHVDPEGTSR